MKTKIGFYKFFSKKSQTKLTEEENKILRRELWSSWTVAQYDEFMTLCRRQGIETITVETASPNEVKEVFYNSGYKLIDEIELDSE